MSGSDTGDLGEDLLYPRRARAAGHALDVEYTGFGIHAEIRSLGGGRHGRCSRCGVMLVGMQRVQPVHGLGFEMEKSVRETDADQEGQDENAAVMAVKLDLGEQVAQ